jgi:hypothetical protein
MTQLLEKAINKIRTLPKAEQEAMAALILEKIPDERQTGGSFGRSRAKVRGDKPPDPPEFLKHKDWEATPENAERICEHIKELIESSRVSEARGIVSKIRPGVSAELDYWKNILALPVPRIGKPVTEGDPKKDMLWIEKNADKYKGKWVALKSGELLGSHESLKKLHRTLKESGKITGSFLFKIGY